MVNAEESPDQSHRNQRVLKIKDKKNSLVEFKIKIKTSTNKHRNKKK
jgi:hypothetical protein